MKHATPQKGMTQSLTCLRTCLRLAGMPPCRHAAFRAVGCSRFSLAYPTCAPVGVPRGHASNAPHPQARPITPLSCVTWCAACRSPLGLLLVGLLLCLSGRHVSRVTVRERGRTGSVGELVGEGGTCCSTFWSTGGEARLALCSTGGVGKGAGRVNAQAVGMAPKLGRRAQLPLQPLQPALCFAPGPKLSHPPIIVLRPFACFV